MGRRELTELNRAFKYRLTYPSPRRTGGVENITPVESDAPAALRATDIEQLARVSYELTQGISQGAIGGVPLREHFKDSLKLMHGERHNAGQRAVAEFLRGPHCIDVDMLGLGRGRSVIEAFGEFLLDQLGHDTDQAILVESELLAALLKTLARHPEPGFFIRHPMVRRTGNLAWVGYRETTHVLRDTRHAPTAPYVYVACGGRYFAGALSRPLVAGLLWGTQPRPTWLDAWSSDSHASLIARACEILRVRGLLP